MEKITVGVRKGAWTKEEDVLLRQCIEKYGEGKWHLVPARAGLNRCRKSCRLRWLNYLSPNIKRGFFTSDEVDLIVRLHKLLGNRWSLIAGRIPGRTANDVKNFWNTHVEKKLLPAADKTTITKSSIIRPRPRVVTHKLQPQPPLMPTTSEANQQANEKENENDECMRWWSSLLDIIERENGSGGPFLFPGEEAPHQMSDGIHNPVKNA